jgi:CheY-like chemotaxis protein
LPFLLVLNETTPSGEMRPKVEPVMGKCILLVEDEPLIAGLLVEMLSADGHHVEAVGTGIGALERLGQRDYDLIVRTSDDPEPGRREWLRAIGQQFGRGRR